MPEHIHFIGIGGSSMSGIAELAMSKGYIISGSDRVENDRVIKLKSMGATVYTVQQAANISDDIDLVIYTLAIAPDNPELLEAQRRGIPTVERGVYLGQFAKMYPYTVAVSGTHGKTTTTSMIASIMISASKEPCIHIGGVLERIHNNVLPSDGDYFVTEACEYHANFLNIKPYAAVVTNIEAEHLDYFKTFDNIISSFTEFVSLCDENGFAVVCGHDENMQAVTKNANCRVITYGTESEFDYYATNINITKTNTSFTVCRKQSVENFDVTINVPGAHNVQNSLAACAVCLELGCSIDSIQDGLLQYHGTARRFEYVGKVNGAPLIDDYAHHPTEIKATLEAARSKMQPDGKLYAIFQPHTFSRAISFFDLYPIALREADDLIVSDIYSAREIDTKQVSGQSMSDYYVSNGINSRHISDFGDIVQYLRENVTEKDMVVMLSAGDLNVITREFVENL